MHILFVCTGNICRSPVAERLMRAFTASAEFGDVSVSSAGTRALVGRPIDPHAARELARLGCDSSNHAARQIKSNMLSSADLILTMSTAHRSSVLALAPQQLNHTFTLSEASRLASIPGAHDVSDLRATRHQLSALDLIDVGDPVGGSADLHAAVIGQIAEMLIPIVRLCTLRYQSASGDDVVPLRPQSSPLRG